MVESTHARSLWWALEPYHAVVYFAPDAKSTYEAIGLKGFWMGYFASRAAPLGAVPAEVVTAAFYNFHPDMVARAIPDAWQLATPAEITAARMDHADRTLRRLLGDDIIASSALAEAAQLAQRAALAAEPHGRPLFAAYTVLGHRHPTSFCGTRRPCCASIAAMDTWPRWCTAISARVRPISS